MHSGGHSSTTVLPISYSDHFSRTCMSPPACGGIGGDRDDRAQGFGLLGLSKKVSLRLPTAVQQKGAEYRDCTGPFGGEGGLASAFEGSHGAFSESFGEALREASAL